MMEFPKEWKLAPVHAALLRRLYQAGDQEPHVVAVEELDAAIQPFRRGAIGRPVKVVLHYLRRRAKPHGISITNHRKAGYALDPAARPILAPFIAVAAE
jgi:hypothetical protein